jgi:serine/threonine-protein kinase HipA
MNLQGLREMLAMRAFRAAYWRARGANAVGLPYPDTVTPELAPAYDSVFTRAYIENERHFALNLGKTHDWYEVELSHFQSLAEHAGIPWRAIKPHLDDVLDKARSLWPRQLAALPMADAQKEMLRVHWGLLRPDFRIGVVKG